MSEKFDLDILKNVKEVSKQNLDSFELEYGDLKIKISGKTKQVVETKEELPAATQEQLSQIEEAEEKTIIQRLEEKDEGLLHDLDYVNPELAGELRRANIIRMAANGEYEYVDEERLDD